MAPKSAEELKVGMSFTSGKEWVSILSIDNKMVRYSSSFTSGEITDTLQSFWSRISRYWTYKEKPLDAALKKLDFSLAGPKPCSHKNIVNDSYFSRTIYKHCVDCGAAVE